MDLFSNIQDIEFVEADAVNIRKGIKELGAHDDDIVEFRDANYDELTKFFTKLNSELTLRWMNEEQNTLVFIYYAGHGA